MDPVADAPSFVLGVAIIRGSPVPVVDLAALVGTRSDRPGRFVTLRVHERQVALAVDEVLGVRSLAVPLLGDLPPLLRGAQPEAVSTMGNLDGELLVVLANAQVVPDALWIALAGEEAAG